MNRLVLIGNGYDLAAGLKTSYEDFLVDYFKGMIRKVANILIQGEFYVHEEDEVITIEGYYDDLSQEIYDSGIDSISNINQLLNHDKIRFTHSDSMEAWQKKTRVRSSAEPNRYDVTVKSNLLQQLLGDYNWRDIENFYFSELLSIFKGIETISNSNRDKNLKNKLFKQYKDSLKLLNIEFEELKNKLVEYISRVSQKNNRIQFEEPLKSLKRSTEEIDEKNFKRFFNNDSLSETERELKKVFIVSFNYTPIYGINNMMYNEKVIPLVIHGQFEKPEDIIFGYGDDSHPLYEKIEQSGNDEYLKYIKSFHYPHNKSYIDLMNYIEADQFEVQIIGHSLGLSDRVLLKSIFENENCKLIKIYHRGNKKDMIHKYMALSRHCSDKATMRRKILEYDEKDVVSEGKQTK